MSTDLPQPESRAGSATPESPRTSRSRGLVCAKCGKYYDISARQPGQVFDCTCGHALTVPLLRPAPPSVPADHKLRIRELRRTRFWGRVSMVIGFVLTIVFASIALHLMFSEQRYGSGACAAVMALGFLIAATIAVNEMRRASAELAGEESGQEA